MHLHSILLIALLSISISISALAQTSTSKPSISPEEMVDRFSQIHQELMPIVGVADMFHGCNQATGGKQYTFNELILEMDKSKLAEELMACLGDDSLASDKALNFGIKSCFIDQLSDLEPTEQAAKLAQVDQLITSLPREERQRSFTQCVNNQTLKYIK